MTGSISSFDSINTLKPAKVNTEYTILQTCSDSTYINLSISNLNGLVITNGEMTNNGTVWFYKFTPNLVSRYDVAYLSDGCEKSGTAYFETKGSNVSLFIIVYILFFGLAFYGIIIKNPWVSLIGCFGLLITGIYTSFNGIDSYKNELTSAVSYITIAIGLGIGFEALRDILEL